VRLVALLMVCWLAGCTQERPVITRQVAKPAERTLPKLTLVRDAYRLEVTQQTGFYGTTGIRHNTLDTDKFGAPGEPSDMSCLEEAIGQAVPAARVLPAAELWRTVGAGRTGIALAELLAPPFDEKLRATGVEFIVAGFSRSEPVSTKGGELLLEGAYESVTRDVAAAVVVDRAAARVIAAIEANVTRETTFAHYLFVLPVFLVTKVEGDTCEAAGSRAGAAIAAAAQSNAPVVAVLAAGSNPYAATQSAPRAQAAPGP
jgi:hypothetical protein